MHEMSIATSILGIAESSMQNYQHLISISVQIGELAGIEIDSLQFCFEAIKQSTRYPDLTLYIERIPGEGLCEKCQQSIAISQLYTMCPRCNVQILKPVQGQELKVTSIEVE